ncbi:MAG: glycoside hydrolase family 15, partial [Actinomycetota bacterium]
RADGSFAARGLPTGGAVGDGRREQFDAVGYVLWAARLVLAEAPDARERLAPLVTRATTHLLAATANGLPAPSSDSWEMHEERLTLGTAAAALMGMDSAASLTGDSAVAARRDRLRREVVGVFGPGGFQRYANPSGSLTSAGRQGADANVALLLPPFQSEPVPGAFDAWVRSVRLLRQPAGGLSPGEGWRNDGVSWTPQTTLYAWVAAENGVADLAGDLVDWTATHRTASGAIPEKVTAEGEPRSVAPLTWSAANVVLAIDALER